MTNMETPSRGRWITTRQASDLAGGIPLPRVWRFIRLNKVTTMKIPGTRLVIDRAEFEAALRAAIRPAEASARKHKRGGCGTSATSLEPSAAPS
jgi:hypothetical protein